MEAEEKHIQELFPRINDIKNSEIKEKVISVWLDAWKQSDFDEIAAMSQWEPLKEKIRISNVEHTNQVVECAIAIAGIVESEQGVDIDPEKRLVWAVI